MDSEGWIPPSYPIYLWFILKQSFHICLGLQVVSLPSFPTKILYAPHLSTIHITCATHLILDIIWIFGQEQKSQNSLWNFSLLLPPPP